MRALLNMSCVAVIISLSLLMFAVTLYRNRKLDCYSRQITVLVSLLVVSNSAYMVNTVQFFITQVS